MDRIVAMQVSLQGPADWGRRGWWVCGEAPALCTPSRGPEPLEAGWGCGGGRLWPHLGLLLCNPLYIPNPPPP
jgi:hypothetical protein